jgi:hypothetical protein
MFVPNAQYIINTYAYSTAQTINYVRKKIEANRARCTSSMTEFSVNKIFRTKTYRKNHAYRFSLARNKNFFKDDSF